MGMRLQGTSQMTEIPEEFRRLTRCFYNGSLEEGPAELDWIERALRLNTTKQLAVVKRFLEEVLKEKDGKKLQNIWNSGAPIYALANDDELRSFLTAIRDAIK